LGDLSQGLSLVYFIYFADGVVILISGKFLSTICNLMQSELNCVQNWCGEIGLNVNADKTSGTFHKKEEFAGFFRPKTLGHGTDIEQPGKISGSHSR
jgi:hypothetical protein